jgi:FlaA1/EpsC-like NDP-sugar epimerase
LDTSKLLSNSTEWDRSELNEKNKSPYRKIRSDTENPRTILVTGASGFIGSRLVKNCSLSLLLLATTTLNA